MTSSGEDGKSARLTGLVFGGDSEEFDWETRDLTAVVTGAGGRSRCGTGGFAYAGAGGHAEVARYGMAMCGDGGTVKGGHDSVVFAYDGGCAEGSDGAVVVSRVNGRATCASNGIARALDGDAIAEGRRSIAQVWWQNRQGITAKVAAGGIAIAMTHDNPGFTGGPALAHAGGGGIAIAVGDNYVSGDPGALLVAVYRGDDGSTRFATAVVDGAAILAGKAYQVDDNGIFVAVG